MKPKVCLMAVSIPFDYTIIVLLHLKAVFYSHWHLNIVKKCFVTKVEACCTYIQVTAMSATCCKKFNSGRVLQHCLSYFVAEHIWMHDRYRCLDRCNIKKMCCIVGLVLPVRVKPGLYIIRMDRKNMLVNTFFQSSRNGLISISL